MVIISFSRFFFTMFDQVVEFFPATKPSRHRVGVGAKSFQPPRHGVHPGLQAVDRLSHLLHHLLGGSEKDAIHGSYGPGKMPVF